MARSLHCCVWVLLLAGACVLGCSKPRAAGADLRPTARSAPSSASPAPSAASRARTSDQAPDAARSSLPKGYVAVSVAGVTQTPAGAAVLLLHDASHRIVPLFVGGTEAMSIELRLEHKRYARPLTHDLLDAVLSKVGATITSVRVDRLEEGTYYATVVMDFEGREHEFDARSSDAIAVALGHGVPIHLSETILAKTGVSVDSVEKPGKLDGGVLDAAASEGTGDITL